MTDPVSSLHNNLPPAELLTYYKSRIESFEEERSELLRKIDDLTADQCELHRLEWENKQRSSEIWELQKTLSTANNALFEERGRLLKLQSENDDLKFQSDEDRKKIQYLLSFTKAGEQEITYLRNERPEMINLSQGDQKPNRKTAPHENVLRTVYLPTANADSLILKVQSLQTQLNEQRHYASERAAAFMQDRKKMEEAFANHRLNFQQRIESSAHKIQRLEEMLRNCTRDYILTRKAKQSNEERATIAESELKQLKAGMEERIRQLKENAASQVHKIKKTTQETVDEYCEKFKEQQVQQKEDEILGLEQIIHATKQNYEGRISELEEKSSKFVSKNKQLEARRSMEKEGFVNEISLLRKKLEVIDRRLHQMRLVERLGEDDRLDRMLQSLENKMPSLGIDGQYLRTCNATDVTSEVQNIQNTLFQIEQKISKTH